MASEISYNRNLYSSLANSNSYPQLRQRLADSAAAATISSQPVQTLDAPKMLELTFEGIKDLLKSYWDGTVPEQKPQDNQPTQPAQTYTARQGDTLLTIATNTLGDGARWKEIWELNKDQLSDPNSVIPGMILKMPTSSAPAVPAVPTTPAAPEPEGSGPLLKSGSRGDAVSKLQSRLLELGCDPGGIDGIMGPNTVNAVKAFQASKGLEADGIVGPLTWKQLGIKVGEAAPTSTTPAGEGSGPLLRSGSRGDAVSKLQSRLLELGCDPGGVDGIMGPNTVNAVKAFQASKGLEADGIVGPNTWKQLGIVVEVSVNFVMPVNGEITSPFGERADPFTGGSDWHNGLDIGASMGEPVQASKGGTIVLAGEAGGYGNCIMVDHGNGEQTRYAHLSEINVCEGDTVQAGQQIGNIGSTGNSTGPHLHFEVIIDGTEVDPQSVLNC